METESTDHGTLETWTPEEVKAAFDEELIPRKGRVHEV